MTLKEHVNDIRDKLAKREFLNEAAVSQGIVLRLLCALDWPIFEIQTVVPEYKVKSGKVDFALCHPSSKSLVFIEVKQVGKIEWADQQLFEYALDYGGIPIAVLTNGQKWQFFYQMGQENYREGKARELDLIEANSEEITGCLNRYLNYESIRTEKAIEAIKQDYETVRQQKQEGIESKSVPPIPPELRHAIVLPNAEDNEVFIKAAWKVACLRWGSSKEGSVLWEDVKEMLPTQFSLECILKNDFYARYVKHLMLTTRTPEQFHNWVRRYGKKNMPKKFGNIMGLTPERVKQMVDAVEKAHNSTTREDNKDAKNRPI